MHPEARPGGIGRVRLAHLIGASNFCRGTVLRRVRRPAKRRRSMDEEKSFDSWQSAEEIVPVIGVGPRRHYGGGKRKG